eukprot:gene6217-8569_t
MTLLYTISCLIFLFMELLCVDSLPIMSKSRLINDHGNTIASNNIVRTAYIYSNNRLAQGSVFRFRGGSLHYARSDERLTELIAVIAQEITSQNTIVSIAVIGAVYIWLKVWTTLASNGILAPNLTRKIIHSGSAPLFLLMWPLYSKTSHANIVAAIIPIMQVIRLYSAGTSSTNNDQGIINAVSRSGAKNEALQGPLIYSLVLTVATIAFFRESAVGIVAVSQMAVGDGLADIFGRRWGSLKWPFSTDKSIVGTLAFIFGGFLSSVSLLALMKYTGYLALDISNPTVIGLIFLISLVSALIELIPSAYLDDNVSVPAISGFLTYLLLEPH